MSSEDQPGRIFTDPSAYGDEGRWHATATMLRREDPVHLVEVDGYRPFWAVTRHADVMEVERHPEIFKNPMDIQVAPEKTGDDTHVHDALRTLVQMNGPEHRAYRGVTTDWFRASQVKALRPGLEQLARDLVDELAETNEPLDFVDRVARPFTLRTIMSMLGLSPDDEQLMADLTQRVAAATDPETFNEDGATAVLMDFLQYFDAVTKARLADPGEDLATVLALAQVNGESMNDLDRLSYFFLIISAGHDTTTAALAGGLEALLTNPDQLAILQANPAAIPGAVEEICRWVTPVKHFMREATEDTELAGRSITEGTPVLLSFPSANRDEDAFDDPFAFRVDREDAKNHVGFGFGHHFCLGAHLARLEMVTFLEEFIPRLEGGELLEGARRTEAVVVSGFRHLPVSLNVRAGAADAA